MPYNQQTLTATVKNNYTIFLQTAICRKVYIAEDYKYIYKRTLTIYMKYLIFTENYGLNTASSIA